MPSNASITPELYRTLIMKFIGMMLCFLAFLISCPLDMSLGIYGWKSDPSYGAGCSLAAASIYLGVFLTCLVSENTKKQEIGLGLVMIANMATGMYYFYRASHNLELESDSQMILMPQLIAMQIQLRRIFGMTFQIGAIAVILLDTIMVLFGI